MAFSNITMLFGGLLVSIPVILHLAMRQQPKLLEFPAIRFIRKQQETNRRQLRLKQWLLLLLRCLAVAAMAIALAQPSVSTNSLGNWTIVALVTVGLLIAAGGLLVAFYLGRGRVFVGSLLVLSAILALVDLWAIGVALGRTDRSLLGNQQAPVAAVLVLDTSMRMTYELENETRLEKAQEMASWLVTQLPADSDVAVASSRRERKVFSVDLAAAQQTINRLETSGDTVSLAEVIRESLDLLDTSNKQRKEIYVFSDITKAAWQLDNDSGLGEALEKAGDVSVYVIDVGAAKPENFSLGNVRFSRETIAGQGELQLTTEIRSVGVSGQRTVELRLELPDDQRPMIQDGKILVPQAERRGNVVKDLEANTAQPIDFRLGNLPVGTHNGSIRIAGRDGLNYDNERFFTLRVKASWPVLLVRGPGTQDIFVSAVLSRFRGERAKENAFQCETIQGVDLETVKLRDYAAVMLLDPESIGEDQWQRIHGFVNDGGGLAVFLGHNARASSFAGEFAQKTLGGKLALDFRAPGGLFLEEKSNHPILSYFKKLSDPTPWEYSPVYRHWAFNPLNDDTQVVMEYRGNGQPAIIDSSFGNGRVLTMTTPITDPSRPRGRRAWNELPTSETPWPYIALIQQIAGYLVNNSASRANYITGETVILANDSRVDPERYQMFTPRGEVQTLTARRDSLTVRTTDLPGTYRIKGQRGGVILRGFSVNLPAQENELERFSEEELKEQLDPAKIQFARDKSEIVFDVREQRLGREFYPYFIAFAALILALEHLFGNRFYRKARATAS